MNALLSDMRAAGMNPRLWEPFAGGAMILAFVALLTGLLWMVQP